RERHHHRVAAAHAQVRRQERNVGAGLTSLLHGASSVSQDDGARIGTTSGAEGVAHSRQDRGQRGGFPMRLSRVLLPAVFILTTSYAFAAVAQHRETTTVEVVQVPVYITADGASVRGLTRDDFTLRVN